MRVLARAYGDKPLDRDVTSSNSRVAYVINRDARRAEGTSNDGVGFPRAYVFRFDGQLFGELQAAWEAGDHDRLANLWNRAEVADLPNA